MPHQFKDNQGRQYTVAMTLGKMRDIRGRYACDVFNSDDWQRVCASLAERLAVLWFIIADQAESYGLDLDAWETALQGEGIATEAGDSFLLELIDFFRRYDQKEMALLTETMMEQTRKAKAQINRPDFKQAIEKTMSMLATNGKP
jgi:hypothetical protein